MKEKRISKLLNNALPILNEYSVLAGFLLSFFLFIVRPIFLNPEHIMKFFVYVPFAGPIGLDLNQMLNYSEAFFIQHGSPYIGNNLYPPLTIFFFGPLLLLDRSTAYAVTTIISVAAYMVTALIIPILVNKHNTRQSVIQLLFITGLFSYGLHFELERGQFNVIAFSLAMLAVYLFHFKPGLRFLSYVLLTVSIQLKVFPLIFLIMLVDDWKDWKTNIARFLKLTLVNIALLFVLGFQFFKEFLKAISEQALNPHITMTNHSIKVFVELITRKVGFRNFFLDRGMELSQIKSWAEYEGTVQLLLQLFAIGCMFAILLHGIRTKSGGFDPYLFAACTILALVLPSVSNDYTLPLITGPLAIVFQKRSEHDENTKLKFNLILLTIIGSFVYSLTLFSYTNKPLLLDNNAPILLTLLLVITVMSMLGERKSFGKMEMLNKTHTGISL